MLQELLKLLDPFYYAVQILQREHGPTSSLVYGQLKQLLYHTSTFASNNTPITEVAKLLNSELLQRFDSLPAGRQRANSILLSLKDGCKPHYIIAAILDPSQAYLVDLDEKDCLKLLRNEMASISDELSISESSATEGEFLKKISIINVF